MITGTHRQAELLRLNDKNARGIIGRFLEHSRIYYFFNRGREEILLGSADMMPRNLNRRIEILYPVQSPRLVRRLRHEVLEGYLSDGANSRHMQPDNRYTRTAPSRSQAHGDSHAHFMALRGSTIDG